MLPRILRNSLCVTLSVAAVLLCAANAHAQGGGIPPSSFGRLEKGRDTRPYYEGDGGVTTTSAPLPFGGQLYCPVTGMKLGLKVPPVPVQTSIGEKKPGAVSSLFGKKTTPGAVIYVCCPACAEKVRQNPEHYLGIVIADKTAFSTRYTQANAPAQRPLDSSDAALIRSQAR